VTMSSKSPKVVKIMSDRFSSAKKILLNLPLSKGEVYGVRLFPFIEIGEIFDNGIPQRNMP